jgi:hypothetical protein
MTGRHALYRFYGHAGELLYIGISLNPGSRWMAHRAEKPWWTDVAQITIELMPDRDSALLAERFAIEDEQPLHNVMHKRPLAPQPESEMDPLLWGLRADHMPADCETCVSCGISSLYHPYKWEPGRGHYRCAFGHDWTVRWFHRCAGEAPECYGVRQKDFCPPLTPEQRRHIRHALAEPPLIGGWE